MLGEVIDYAGDSWEIICLNPNTHLSRDQKRDMYHQVLDMHYNKNRRKKVRGEGFEGLAKKVGFAILGMFPRYQYDMDLEIDGVKETTKHSFIISGNMDPELN